jgi:hypothetical protein
MQHQITNDIQHQESQPVLHYIGSDDVRKLFSKSRLATIRQQILAHF